MLDRTTFSCHALALEPKLRSKGHCSTTLRRNNAYNHHSRGSHQGMPNVMLCCFIGGQRYLDKVERQSTFMLHAGINEGSATCALDVLAELCALRSSKLKRAPELLLLLGKQKS